MGYTTDFYGEFVLNKKLDQELQEKLIKFSEDRHESNVAPTPPSYWCQWIPTEDGLHITWDGGEKFYEYVAWLQYLCDHFLAPNGYILNGSVQYQGEDHSDVGWVVCVDNQARLSEAMLVPRVTAEAMLAQSGSAATEPAPAKPKKNRVKKMTFSSTPKRILDIED
jgi:hypothetical protein